MLTRFRSKHLTYTYLILTPLIDRSSVRGPPHVMFYVKCFAWYTVNSLLEEKKEKKSYRGGGRASLYTHLGPWVPPPFLGKRLVRILGERLVRVAEIGLEAVCTSFGERFKDSRFSLSEPCSLDLRTTCMTQTRRKSIT